MSTFNNNSKTPHNNINNKSQSPAGAAKKGFQKQPLPGQDRTQSGLHDKSMNTTLSPNKMGGSINSNSKTTEWDKKGKK